MAQEITVTRALVELKLYDAKIESAMRNCIPLAIQQGKKKIGDRFTVEEFSTASKAALQKVKDLVANKKKVKAAIIKSNSSTNVIVGKQTMTVAEAIARKQSIETDSNFLQLLIQTRARVLQELEKGNASCQQRLDALLVQNFGKDRKVDDKEVEGITKPFLENNEFKLIDPNNINELIETLQNELDEFNSNVDFALSESNATTKITVEM